MAKKCTQCGHDNDDTAARCVCGTDLQAEAAAPPTLDVPPEGIERSFCVRKIAFAVWALGFVPLFAAVRSHLGPAAPRRGLVGAGVFWVTAVAALWLLGREKTRALRIWRGLFVAWAMLLLPLLLTMADGLVSEGWPTGKFNRSIAQILTLLLVVTVPAFLLGLLALLRARLATSALAIATGLAYLVDAVYLIRVTAPAPGLRLQFQDVLDIVLLSAQLLAYPSIPVGIAMVVGGIMTFRARRRA
jgi:hypothetical protein